MDKNDCNETKNINSLCSKRVKIVDQKKIFSNETTIHNIHYVLILMNGTSNQSQIISLKFCLSTVKVMSKCFAFHV
jgi:hypothetical protein